MEISSHCRLPYECSVFSHCWKDVPPDSVFTLTNGGSQTWGFWRAGIQRVVDLSDGEKYSPRQLIQIQAERTELPHVDVPVIRQFLAGLRYPLHFLDFETVMPAIPMFDGCRPYGQVPFQFSLHVQASPNGELVHHEFLADSAGDPRPGFLEALRACLGPEGSIVSYNAPFEMSCLRELAKVLPQHAAWIESILPRFAQAELLKPFQTFALYHPSQHGSVSLKSVLPAFTDLSYDELQIQEGGSASVEFLNFLKGLVPEDEISALRQNLSLYCERDTFAMVKLVEKLQELAN